MNLTRRQVRLLTTSAGDHERMPEDDSQEGQDLSAPKDMEIKAKHISRIRDAAKHDGSRIAKTSHIVDKYIGRKLNNIEYKEPVSPVKNRVNTGNTESAKSIIDMARRGQGNIKMGNKLKNKLNK